MHKRLVATTALVLALAGTAAHAAPVVLTATLAGANEPAGGDSDGSGAFRVEIDADTGDFCYTLTGSKIAAPTMAHVHSGAAGTDGPVVVKLDVTGTSGDMCIAMEPDKLKPIIADPASFYVNIHTADFPKGAVRGQLAKQ